MSALARKQIAGAALDVTAVQPLPPADPLLAVENLLAFFRGEKPPFCVNPEVLTS